MRVETGLVVVGSADNYLRISKKKKRAEGITQSVVDRCIVVSVSTIVHATEDIQLNCLGRNWRVHQRYNTVPIPTSNQAISHPRDQ